MQVMSLVRRKKDRDYGTSAAVVLQTLSICVGRGG